MNRFAIYKNGNLIKMKNTELTPMEFESSNGTLLVNEDGSINKDSDFDNDSWLSEILKVDIEELDNYYKIQGLGKCEGGDVLDFGYWTKGGVYNAPSLRWRLETFHPIDFKTYQVLDSIKKSIEWIEENRDVYVDHKELLYW